MPLKNNKKLFSSLQTSALAFRSPDAFMQKKENYFERNLNNKYYPYLIHEIKLKNKLIMNKMKFNKSNDTISA